MNDECKIQCVCMSVSAGEKLFTDLIAVKIIEYCFPSYPHTLTHTASFSINQRQAGDWVSSLSVWLSCWFALIGHSASVTSVFTSLTESGWISHALLAARDHSLFFLSPSLSLTGAGCNHNGAHGQMKLQGATCCVCVRIWLKEWSQGFQEAFHWNIAN